MSQMPLTYEIYEDLGLLLLRHAGRTGNTEQRHALDRLGVDPSYHPGLMILIDTKAVDASEITLGALMSRREEHERQLATLKTPTRWSYFAPSAHCFGLCRRAQILFENLPNLEIGVFETTDEALAFLGLAADDLPDWP